MHTEPSTLHIESSSLGRYPILKKFVETKDNFDVILEDDAFKKLYVLHLFRSYNTKRFKQLKLNIVEICALLGLHEHLIYLSQKLDIYHYVKKGKFIAFRFAVANLHREVFHLLMRFTPDNNYEFLTSYEYRIFFYTAKTGSLMTMNALLKIAGKGHVNKMIASHQFRGFKIAVEYRHTDIINRLLQHPFSLKHFFNNISLYLKEFEDFISFTIKDLENLPEGKPISEEKQEFIGCLIYYLNELIKENADLKNKASSYLSSLVQIPQVTQYLMEKLTRRE